MIAIKTWNFKPYRTWGPLKLDSEIERWDLEDIFGEPTHESVGRNREIIYFFETTEGPLRAVFSASLSFQYLILPKEYFPVDIFEDADSYEIEFHYGYHVVYPNLGLSTDINLKETLLYGLSSKNFLLPTNQAEAILVDLTAMEPDEFKSRWEEIKSTLHPNQIECLKPAILKQDETALRYSQFGGMPLLKADEPWPECEICRLKLSCVFQTSSTELARSKDFSEEHLFQFFHCMNEQCHEFHNELDADEKHPYFCRLEPIALFASPGSSTIAENKNYLLNHHPISNWVLAPDGPRFEELRSNDLRFQLAYERMLPDIEDKIGGSPAFLQDTVIPKCPHCKRESERKMSLFLQFNSRQQDLHGEWIFGDSGCAYVFQCNRNKAHFTVILQTT
jgi:uncharacterized protein YwqG